MGLVSAHGRMANVKLRQAIALEAARLMYERTESEYYTAKRKAAKRLCRQTVKPADLPSNAEIREQIQVFSENLNLLKRLPTLAEVANVAAFMASDQSSAMTAAVANLSAGLIAD